MVSAIDLRKKKNTHLCCSTRSIWTSQKRSCNQNTRGVISKSLFRSSTFFNCFKFWCVSNLSNKHIYLVLRLTWRDWLAFGLVGFRYRMTNPRLISEILYRHSMFISIKTAMLTATSTLLHKLLPVDTDDILTSCPMVWVINTNITFKLESFKP